MTRVGVVGLGYWGPNLARNFDRLPEVELAWLCDESAEALDRLSRAFPGARATASFHEVLGDRHRCLLLGLIGDVGRRLLGVFDQCVNTLLSMMSVTTNNALAREGVFTDRRCQVLPAVSKGTTRCSSAPTDGMTRSRALWGCLPHGRGSIPYGQMRTDRRA